MMLSTVVIIAAIATAVALVLGVRSMVIGGVYDQHHSGQLMSVRIALQLVAFVLMVPAAYFAVR
jgi:hypothetical protein